MSKHGEPVIRIWPYSEVPQSLKHLSEVGSEWVALVPPNLALPELEEVFLRWQINRHRVMRHILADGSILYSGRLCK